MTTWTHRARNIPPSLAVACLAAVGLFAGTIAFGFTYDDVPIIAQNNLIHHLENWRGILAARWWNDALYRPVTLYSFAIDWSCPKPPPSTTL